MTTTEQESTPSGGLERKPTTIKIELGVLKTSVAVSQSMWTDKTTISLKFYDNPSHPLIKEVQKKDDEDDWYDYEYNEPRETTESRNRKRIAGEILERFRVTSIVRYIEAWNGEYKVNQEFILRSMKGSSEFGKALVGMFGAFNKKVFEKANNAWQVIHFEKLYPQVKRLPKEGIERMHSVFRENKK